MRWQKVCLLWTCFAVGCSGEPKLPAPPPAPTPLSVSGWRELPVTEKYDDATFQRLKMADPKLRDDRAWNRFMVQTVVPERKKDLPDDFATN